MYMSNAAIVAKVRVHPFGAPDEEWLIPMWHGDGRYYRFWLPFPAETPYDVLEVIAAPSAINERHLDYAVAERVMKDLNDPAT